MGWSCKFDGIHDYALEKGETTVWGQPYKYVVVSDSFLQDAYYGEPLPAGGCGDSQCFVSEKVPERFRYPLIVHEAIEEKVWPTIFGGYREPEMHRFVCHQELLEAQRLGILSEYVPFRIRNLNEMAQYHNSKGAGSLEFSDTEQITKLENVLKKGYVLYEDLS